jgi:hypothetical protein
MTDLTSALWRVNLMLVLNRSLLNTKWTRINFLKASMVTISMCILNVILTSNITRDI